MSIQVERDNEGYLIDPEDWTEEIAKELAKEENIELDDRYWPVLNIIRTLYSENQIIPDVMFVM